MIYPQKRLILLELNELNFDVVEDYIKQYPGRFLSFEKILSGSISRSSAEDNYDQLEPWIQWPSVHTGKPYKEHNIFRLGDIVRSPSAQIFEQLESVGYKVGVVSAMNAENRLSKPSYFIPDPWTDTPADNSWWSRSLSKALSQTVNDNASSRITFKSALTLILSFFRFGKIKNYVVYFKYLISSRKKPWLKAVFLDLLLHDLHLSLFLQKKPNFSTLFLNAGAHIQHHYFFNALPLRKSVSFQNPTWYLGLDDDPLADVLHLYDFLIGDLLDIPNVELLISTGLSQKPYESLIFYYRLRNHEGFLNQLGIQYQSVHPRMTRDFLVEFADSIAAAAAEKLLRSILVDNDLPLFGLIDNRGKSLFITLTYPSEISHSTRISFANQSFDLSSLVIFVAIKNGMHQSKGFSFFTSGIAPFAPADGSHVCFLYDSVLSYFGLRKDQFDNITPKRIC